MSEQILSEVVKSEDVKRIIVIADNQSAAAQIPDFLDMYGLKCGSDYLLFDSIHKEGLQHFMKSNSDQLVFLVYSNKHPDTTSAEKLKERYNRKAIVISVTRKPPAFPPTGSALDGNVVLQSGENILHSIAAEFLRNIQSKTGLDRQAFLTYALSLGVAA